MPNHLIRALGRDVFLWMTVLANVRRYESAVMLPTECANEPVDLLGKAHRVQRQVPWALPSPLTERMET